MQAEVEQFMQNYCAIFKPDNPDRSRILDFYHVPVSVVFADKLTVVDNTAAATGMISGMLDALAGRNFKESKIDAIHVTPLSAGTALVSAAFTRYCRDGSVLERLGATYTVIRTDRGLKIVAVIAHEVEMVWRGIPAR